MSDDVLTLRLPTSGGAAAPPVALVVLGSVLLLALGCLVAAPLAAPVQPGWAWLLGAIGIAVALWVSDVLLTLLTRGGRVRLRLVVGAVEVVGSRWSRPVDVVAPLAFLALVGLLRVLGRSRRRSRLRLAAGGLEVSGPQGRGEFEWDALTGAREMPLAVRTVAGSWVSLPGSELRSDPALLARLVEHYRTHPRDRHELADERVVERVRAGHLAPLAEPAR